MNGFAGKRLEVWRHATAPRRRGRQPRSGFTLIELAIAISILMIGMVSIVSVTTRMHSLRKQNRERNVVQNATRTMAERIHARSYLHSSDPTTWAANVVAEFSPGGRYGDEFDVEGLNLVPGEDSVGTITIVTDESVTDAALGAQVGMPRDLDGDGDQTDTDVVDSARILPVLLRLRWSSQTGTNEYEHAFYLMGY